MGDYTGLVCKVRIKKEFHDLIRFINSDHWVDVRPRCKPVLVDEYKIRKVRPKSHRYTHGYNWELVSEKFGYGFLNNFSKNSRNWAIPFGSYSSYNRWWLMEYKEEYTPIQFSDDIWFFACDLKNYTKTIEIFINDILRNIVEDDGVIILKTKYEDDGEEDISLKEKISINTGLKDVFNNPIIVFPPTVYLVDSLANNKKRK